MNELSRKGEVVVTILLYKTEEFMKNKKITQHDIYNWCLENAAARYIGTLSQDKIDKLNEIGFPWAYYEDELDK